MRNKIFILIIFLSSSSLIFAQSSNTGADFLKIGVGPRPVGMGSVFTGIGDDVYTMYWNPGGIGFVRRWEYSAMYNKYFADMYYLAISGVRQYRMLGSRRTAFGLGLFYHGMPEWDATEGNPSLIQQPEIGTASNVLGIISFGQRMDWLTENLAAGLNAKIGYSKLVGYDAWTFAADIGLMYRLVVWNKPLSVGFTTQNIGIQTAFIDEKAVIPLGFRIGASYRIWGCPNHGFLIATDVSKYKLGNLKVGFGAEYSFRGIVAIRGGYNYNQDDLGDISFGASVGFDAFNSGSQIDYSQTDFGNVLEYDRKAAFSLHDVVPIPFDLYSPASGDIFCKNEIIPLKWENSEDQDFCDSITYRILIDTREAQVKKAVEQVCENPEQQGASFLDLATKTTEFQFTRDLAPDTYYWSIIAMDRRGHTRWCNEIRHFTRSAPDIIIRDISFIPSKIMADINEDYQGEIKFVIENLGKCKGYNFNVVLKDSFCCENKDLVVAEFPIDSIGPGKAMTKYFTWYTNEIGKHRFFAVVDPENQVEELNDENNENSCFAITIPRGRVIAEKDTLDTKLVTFSYCEIPIVPMVFFEKDSVSVSEEYYIEDPIRPTPMLRVIADRLINNNNLKLELSGYIDPFSEPGRNNLASERTQKVYSLLVDVLGAPTNQVILKKNYDDTKRGLERSSEPMVNAENRRVELSLNSLSPDPGKTFQLFGPLQINGVPRISDGLAFDAEVKAYVDIVCWQLILNDVSDDNIVYRMNFRIDQYRNTYDMKDQIIWLGTDNENRVVDLNHSYLYSMKIQDKLGRDFYTKPKPFHVKCDLVEHQRLQVHLNQFDTSDRFFVFDNNRLEKLAEALCDSPSMKIKFNGYACDIGTRERNIELAFERGQTSNELFLQSLIRTCSQRGLNPQVQNAPTMEELKTKYAGYPGHFAEPIKYYNPCTFKEYIFPMDNPYGRVLSRRVDIVLYSEEGFEPVAKQRKK